MRWRRAVGAVAVLAATLPVGVVVHSTATADPVGADLIDGVVDFCLGVPDSLSGTSSTSDLALTGGGGLLSSATLGGSGATTVGGAVAAAPAATLGTIAAVAAGSFCGGVNIGSGLDALANHFGIDFLGFGSESVDDLVAQSYDTPQGVTISAPSECGSLGATAHGPANLCVLVTWQALPFFDTNPPNRIYLGTSSQTPLVQVGTSGYRLAPQQLAINLQSGAARLAIANQAAVNGGYNTPPVYGPASVVVEVDCSTLPNCGFTPESYVQVSYYDAAGDDDQIYMTATIYNEWTARGYQTRIERSTECKTPGGTTQTVADISSWFWSGEGFPVDKAQPLACPEGSAPIAISIAKRINGGSYYTSGHLTPLLTWEADPQVVSNDTTLQCWVVGVTSCPIHETSPTSPTVEIGGPGGVSVPRTDMQTTTQDRLQEVLQAQGQTTPTTTIAGSGPGIGEAGSGDPSGVPNASSDEASCMASGWGWNPINWVLKPIKCAFEWAFIPGDGWLDPLTDLSDTPPLSWAVDGITFVASTSITFADWGTAGPACFEAMSADICPRDWDVPFPGWFVVMIMVGLWSWLAWMVVAWL